MTPGGLALHPIDRAKGVQFRTDPDKRSAETADNITSHHAWRTVEAFIAHCPGHLPLIHASCCTRRRQDRQQGSNTMSNVQNGSLITGNVVRRDNSQQIARGGAEPQQSLVTALTTELREALTREAALVREKEEKDESLQREIMLTQEFEHRLVNSLQVVVSLLSLQSRKTESPEAAEQLMIAAKRVAAFGRVHRQLHLLDLLNTVELKQYVAQLCKDINEMLFDGVSPRPVVVEGVQIEIPTTLGVPLGFIVNELVTNAAKHATGEIIVRLETTAELGHCLSVSNGGPGLPTGFRPGSNKGLGLRIVRSLVRQINGRLQVGPGPGQQGACFQVFFPSTD
jgi:two-component sensor histidine kinase